MTGTQKILAIAGAAGVVIIAVVLLRKPDEVTSKPDAAETSSGVVATTTTVTTPTTVTPSASGASPVTSGKPVDVGALAEEAKLVSQARSELAAGEPRKALATIERWERDPAHTALKPEATMVKIEALSKVGRRTDALALGMQTRDDPQLAPYQGRIDALLQDAGLIGPIQTPPPTP